MSIDYQLNSLFAKEAFVRHAADGYVELAFRRDYFQETMIDVVLSEGQFQVLKFGCADETFDFNDDSHSMTLSGEGFFSSKIGIQLQFFVLNREWIVSNRPAIFYQSVLHGVVNDVQLGHGNGTNYPFRNFSSIASRATVSAFGGRRRNRM
jgi:hypothetical protein